MKNVVVVGSGRSGTSMVAGALARAGYFVGEDPYPGRDANPKGFFEARDVNGVNEWLIASVESRDAKLCAWQRWLSIVPESAKFEPEPALVERMRRLTARTPFCFKDPRFSFTLPAWRDALGDARFLCVFREPAATAASILKECAEADYLRGVDFDVERALEVWNAMYRRVLDQHRHRGLWRFVHFDQVLTSEGLDRIAAFTESQVAREFPEARFKRSKSDAPVPRAVAETYRELCALAGFANAPIALREPTARTSVAVREFETPKLSVILCTYNRRDTLAESIATFEKQTAPLGSFELIIVDDGSSDGTATMLAERNFAIPTQVLRRENGGLSAARNTGIAKARGELLLLVNDDTLAFPDLVERHIEAHAKLAGEKVSVLGTFEQPPRALDNALMRSIEQSSQVFCYAAMKPGSFYDWNRFWTCNVSVPRAALVEAGGFDEKFRRYGCEDTDVALRLDELGYRVYFDGTARAHHRHVLDLAALKKRQRTVAQAWVHLFKKHPRALEHPDWSWVREFSMRELERSIDERLPELLELERAANELAKIDVFALGGEAATIIATLEKYTSELNPLWWRQGFVAGLAELGVDAFERLIPPTPWPLSTEAPTRLLAWPNWTRADLDHLMREFAPVIVGRDDVCIVLVLDPLLDESSEEAQRALVDSYSRRFVADEAVQVLILDDPLADRDLARLGLAIDAVLELPSSFEPARKAFVDALGRPLLRNSAQLEKRVAIAHSIEREAKTTIPA